MLTECSATLVPKTTPLCPYSLNSPCSFVNGGYLWMKSYNYMLPVAHHDISVSLRCLGVMTNRDKVSWSPTSPSASREQWSIFSSSLCLHCHWVVTGLVCLCNIWLPVTETCDGVLYPCSVSAGRTPVVLNSVDLREERSWHIMSL